MKTFLHVVTFCGTAFLLSGCSEKAEPVHSERAEPVHSEKTEPIRSVEWYREHSVEREAMLKKCRDNPKDVTPDCLYSIAADYPAPSKVAMPTTKEMLTTARETIREMFPEKPVKQGVHQLFTSAKLIAPFRIVTPVGTEKYYVKLIDATTDAPVMTFFIYGGQSFDTHVPLGAYHVKYATGTTWYGTSGLFGPDTRYSETDKTFTFTSFGNQINGYTIELIRQHGGNLHTKSISANQF